MGWKDWPYWKKGGMISFYLGCLTYLTRWTLYTLIGDHFVSYFFKIILIIMSFPIFLLNAPFYLMFGNLVAFFIDLTFSLAWWFFIGSIIGLIIGRKKNSKNDLQQVKNDKSKDFS